MLGCTISFLEICSRKFNTNPYFTMKKLFTLLAVALVALPTLCSAQEEETHRSLNDIRFDGWTDEDWLDNDYIRTLRTYIDACYRGEVEDDSLKEYREASQSKFVILAIQPALIGGTYILFSFLDAAERVFSSTVYSYVDEEDEKVTGYEVRYIRLLDEESGYTKEEILTYAAEDPRILLW